jgi:hypothetical protein
MAAVIVLCFFLKPVWNMCLLSFALKNKTLLDNEHLALVLNTRTLRDLGVICGLVRYPTSLLHGSRPPQGGVRTLIGSQGATVFLTDN